MASLTLNDYRAVLSFYGINHMNMIAKEVRKQAQDVLAKKLCRCIKQVDKKDEKKSIAICRKNVLIRKGIDMYGFSCKNKPKFHTGKNSKRLRVIGSTRRIKN